MLPVYYINLDSRTDRRAFMERQLSEMGVHGTRFTAVTHTKIKDPGLKHPLMRGRSPMREAEMACLESHALIWKLLIESGADAAVVLEDDAILGDALPNLLSSVASGLPKGVDMLRLETWFEYVRLGSSVFSGPVELMRLMQGQPGSAGYIISPAFARHCLSSPYFGAVPVDLLLSNEPSTLNHKIYQTVPGIVAQMDRIPSADVESLATSSIDRPAPMVQALDQLSEWSLPGRLSHKAKMVISYSPSDLWHGRRRRFLGFAG